MVSSVQLIQLIKEISRDERNSSRPFSLLFGTVIKEEPDLTIDLEQHKTLTKEFLVLCREVTDYDVDMTVDHITEDADEPQTDKMAGGGGDAMVASHLHIHHHKHPYKGRKSFRVHKKLLVGEKVAVLAMQGGQKYLVIDRIVEGSVQ